MPYLVADIDGQAAGLAFAAPFRTRAAYRYTVEDSVYIAADRLGRGIGKALLAEVIGTCEALGLRQMVALIGDSASGEVHRRAPVLRLRAGRRLSTGLGFKAGRWVDVVMMQRRLNAGTDDQPTGYRPEIHRRLKV